MKDVDSLPNFFNAKCETYHNEEKLKMNNMVGSSEVECVRCQGEFEHEAVFEVIDPRALPQGDGSELVGYICSVCYGEIVGERKEDI